jgi:hypothetical protein
MYRYITWWLARRDISFVFLLVWNQDIGTGISAVGNGSSAGLSLYKSSVAMAALREIRQAEDAVYGTRHPERSHLMDTGATPG